MFRFRFAALELRNVALLLIIIGSMVGTGRAQTIEYLGSTLWTGVPDIEVVDGYGYCSFHNGLLVLDVHDPTSLEFVTEVRCPGRGEGIDVEGNFVYLADGDFGFCVIDISDPQYPVLASCLPIAGYTMDVKYQDGFAYLATWWHGLQIIDVSDPYNPVWYSGAGSNGGAWGVDVQGDLAAIADGTEGVMLYDISLPDVPLSYGSVLAPRFAHDVQFVDTLLYVGCTEDYSHSGLVIYDVSNPSNPESLATHFTADAWGIDISGHYAYMVHSQSGLIIADVIDPFHPARVGWWQNTDWGNNLAVCVVDTIAFVANGQSQEHNYIWGTSAVYAINVANPAEPNVVGIYHGDGESMDVVVRGNLAYVADGQVAVRTVSLDDPRNPRVLGTGYYDDLEIGRRISVDGTYAAIHGLAYFYVYDVSDPTAPVYVDEFRDNGDYNDCEIRGSLIYDLGSHYLGVFSVADGEHIDSLSACATTGSGSRIELQYPYAYFTGGGYLEIANVADSMNPVILSSTEINATDVKVRGTFAYLSGYDSSLFVVDIGDRSHPSLVSTTHLNNGRGWGIGLQGDYAWVAERAAGIEVVDISRPLGPVPLASFDTNANCLNVASADSFVVVADEQSLMMLRFDPPSGAIEPVNVPRDFRVFQNYPNPFNAMTRIHFMLDHSGRTTLKVFDVQGREVATLLDEMRNPGPQMVTWDANGMASGVYFARLVQGKQEQTVKMVLVR